MRAKILVLDSGVGGLGVLLECTRLLPEEEFLYVADTKFSPYGNKSRRKLKKIIHKTLLNILATNNIKMIILACNTATASAIKYLRKKINLPFVGIEPAIKLAIEKGEDNILLLSTRATLKYNKNLVALKCKRPKNIFFLPLKNLAKEIDKNLKNLKGIQPLVDRLFFKYKTKNIKSVVLGCTHYQFVVGQIQRALNNFDLHFFESSKAVARQVKRLLDKNNLRAKTLKNYNKPQVVFYCTKPNTLQKILPIYFKNLKKDGF